MYTPRSWGKHHARSHNTWNFDAVRQYINLLLIPLLIWILSISGETSAQSDANAPDNMIALTQAQLTVREDTKLPDSNARWRDITLPVMSRNLSQEDLAISTQGGSIWVRLTLPQNQVVQGSTQALLFWRYNLALTIYVNGTEIASNGFRENRTTIAWNHPLLAVIPNDGDNTADEVLIRLYGSSWGANLAPVILGPASELQERFESRMFMQVEVNRILLAFAITIATFTFLLWLMRRQDSIYLWFSGACFSWAFAASHTVILYNVFSFETWIPLIHSAMDICTLCIYGFLGRLANERIASRERLFIAWTALAVLIHNLIPSQWFWYSAYLLHVVGIIVLAALMLRVGGMAIRSRQTESIIITTALSTQVILFGINAFQMFFGDGSGWDRTLNFGHFGIPVLLLVFAWVLLRRFTRALDTAETLNRDLEKKVAESREIIRQGFEERRKLELSEAASAERIRIYRDLHDDVGSRLLSIIHAEPDDKIGNMARETLESLRQTVSKANTTDQPLAALLADIQEESTLRLEGSGHKVEWLQEPANYQIIVAANTAFHVNRICKELVSNIIRHAKASQVTFVVKRIDDAVSVVVTDNGCGITEMTVPGNGLQHLRARAETIHADIEWHGSSEGTSTRLYFWCHQHQERPGKQTTNERHDFLNKTNNQAWGNQHDETI